MMNLRLPSRTATSLRLGASRSLARRYKSAPTGEKVAAVEASESTSTSTNVPVAKSLLAAVVGISTVSGIAALVESATASSVPVFDPRGQRFDQSSFVGRFSRMLLACDPRLLFYTESQVLQAQATLEKYQDCDTSMDRVMWEAKRIADAAVHPDTGEFIPRPFRMSGFVPYNGPICVAMLAAQSTPTLLFWAWVNQSQNALVNYFNRNACSPLTNETLMKSYAAAVGSALAVAFGLATVIQKRYSPEKAKALLRWVAFPSAVVASSLNCYIVRSPEIESGIPLQGADGSDVSPGETSQVAGRLGVNSTTISRAILQAPVYFLPPVLLTVGPIRSFLARQPAMAIPVTTYMLLVSFGVGLPVTTALFPQISAIEADKVEERFQHLRDPKTQQPYEVFYYNKGL
jgi:tricarboxylate carrier